MKRNHLYILIGLALLISLMLLPQPFLEKTAYRIFGSTGKFAEVKEVIGRGEKSYAGSTQWIGANAGDEIGLGDAFLTHGDSKILFQFDPPFWLMPYSKIEFLKNEDEVIGHLIYGEIKKLQGNPENPAITLKYDEKNIDAESFSSASDTLITPLVQSDGNFKDLSLNNSAPDGTMEKQIFQTLLLHKKFFQTCLIKLYKKQAGTKGGQTVFDLFIQVNGVIEKATVTRTDIQDQEYIDCLKQVLDRVRFKDIALKEPLHATFPLNISL
jgi:hypothetical protein